MTTQAGVAYTVGWVAACLVAGILVARAPGEYAFTRRAYLRFLTTPWKLGTFVLATTAFAVAAPWTGDPTWDAFDAIMMSVLTYLTAPWAVGALYRIAWRRLPLRQAWVAGCVWLLSASWCYDLYLFVRDRTYPPTWASNIGASSAIYCLAGLFWSLGHRPGRGATLAFMEEEWPPAGPGGLGRAWPWAVLFAGLVALMLGLFVALNAMR